MPTTKSIYLAELATGANTNPEQSLFSQVDFSSLRIQKGIRDSVFPYKWLDRIKAVIHVYTSPQQLENQLRRRAMPSLDELTSNTTSLELDTPAHHLSDRDDFTNLRGYFNEWGIPVIDITNKGDTTFKQNLVELTHNHELFPFNPSMTIEGKISSKRERF